MLEVGKRLVERSHKVTVVTESPPPRSPFQLRQGFAGRVGYLGGAATKIDGIDIVRHDFGGGDWFKKFRIWKWLWQNRNLIKNADVVQAHDVFFWYLPFRFLYPTKSVYTTFHGYETRFPPTKKAILWRKLSEKLSWGNICVGDYIEKWYGTNPTYVTYGGVDVHLGGVEVRKAKFKIVLIGRLEKDIGIPFYLEVLDVLKKKKVDFSFEAYGEGSLQKQIEKYGKVYKYPENIEEKIVDADIIFASSYLTILQVLACKKLVIAVYDNPLKKDYLEMAPFAKWIIIENSSEKLVEKILYYKRYKNAGKILVDNAYNWAKDQTWDKVTNLYLKLWKVQ